MNRELNTRKSQAGFTLVEMMISMTIFLIATGAIFGLLKIASIQKKTASNRTDQLKSARIALEYLRRDALNAGFGYHRIGGNSPDNTVKSLFGLPTDGDTQRDLMTSIIAGNNVSANSLNTATNMDFVAFLSRDPSFNEGKLVNYEAAKISGNNIYLETKDGAATNCTANDVYLIEPGSGTTQILAMATSVTGGNKITLAVNDPLNLNQSATATVEDDKNLLVAANAKGIVKKINIVSYSITNEGTLVRRVHGNQTGASQIETRELVFGVSDFQVRYFLENGNVLDNPSNNHTNRNSQLILNDIVQIQISVTITPSFNGSGDTPGTPVTIKEYISTRNLRYQAS